MLEYFLLHFLFWLGTQFHYLFNDILFVSLSPDTELADILGFDTISPSGKKKPKISLKKIKNINVKLFGPKKNEKENSDLWPNRVIYYAFSPNVGMLVLH